jgi:hypothetical protein
VNNKVNTDNLDSFFSFVSKAVIIVPIVVVVLSLMFKFNQIKTGRINPTPTTTQIAQKNSFKFDLKGPIVCGSLLFVKDKKVFFKNKQVDYLLNGDCLYSWEEGKNSGEKKCGLTNYLNLAENYLGSMDINDLANNTLVKGFINEKNIDISTVLKNCKREEIKDESVFEIPKKVIFKS